KRLEIIAMNRDFMNSLVGSLAIGSTFFFSPLAGIVTDKIGIRWTTFLGGAMAAGGMLLSSFCNSVEFLYLTYGILFGIGASLAYTPSLVILGHYFKRYLGVVNGFVTAGSSVFTIIMPFSLAFLLAKVNLESTMICMAVLISLIMGCAMLFKPLPGMQQQSSPAQTSRIHGQSFWKKVRGAVNVDIWKKKRYVIWALAVPSALFGYFVPYVHMLKFVEDTIDDGDGKIADIPKVNRIVLQQISFFSIGLLTMLLTVTNSFSMLVVISLFMGLFDGCFISLLGPIAFEICGQKGASQAIGFLLGFCSIPLTVGPPIAGMIYDVTKSYTIPFRLAGIPPIVGALALSLMHCVRDQEEEEEEVKQNTMVSLTEAPLHESSATLQNDVESGKKIANGIYQTKSTIAKPPSFHRSHG
ncbi:hypothetical protein L9F63_018777, partial [Diploptera punctata]